MYNLVSAVFVETLQAISVSWLEAGLGIITIIVTIMGTAWRINRASKQDIDAKLVKKVDVMVFEKTCELNETKVINLGDKIAAQEKTTDDKYKTLDKKLDKIDNNVNKLIDFHLNEKK